MTFFVVFAPLLQLEALQADLPLHWTKDFFTAHALLEMHANTEALAIYEDLSAKFPGSPYVQGQVAQALYNMRGKGGRARVCFVTCSLVASSSNRICCIAEFDTAQRAFEKIRAADPFRLDGMDSFSNILYVKEARVRCVVHAELLIVVG